jgi:protein-disulfide isomerase/uncharacterized membrane protein
MKSHTDSEIVGTTTANLGGKSSDGTTDAPAESPVRPFFLGRSPFVLLLILALIGTFAAAFLTYRHVMLESHFATFGQSFLCGAGGKINCDAILMSEYAVLFGFVSSAALGLTGFTFVLWNVICGVFNDRIRKVSWVLLVAYFFAAIGFSWYYIYVMAFEVDFICTWCIVVHVMNLLSLIVVLTVSIGNRQAFLLKEIATLSERVYFVAGGVLLSLLVFALAGMAEKALRFEDLKVQYEELVNDTSLVLAIIRSSPTYDVPIGPEDPVFGSPGAPYAIVLFSDFQCPACAKAEKLLREIVLRNKEALKLVYKNYPLSKECNTVILAQTDFHPMACQAARAAYSAYLLGGSAAFWAYGDLLFANQKHLKKRLWTTFAGELKLDVNKFSELMEPDSPADKKVRDDVKLGLGLQLNGTPKIFFEGKRIPDNFAVGYLTDTLEELIRSNHPEQQDLRLNR